MAPYRKRFERSDKPAVRSVTPIKLAILSHLLDYRFLLVSQLCKLTSMSDQAVRRHLRELYDMEMVTRSAVSRSVIADNGEPNDETLTQGSAPIIYSLSKVGFAALLERGLADAARAKDVVVKYGPANDLFLRHELFLRDIRIWMATLSGEGVRLRTWKDTAESEIRLPIGVVLRPDATFVLDVGEYKGRQAVLTGFIEADRGTERGAQRWSEKIAGYIDLFSRSECVASATGYRAARILIIAPDHTRIDWIHRTIEQRLLEKSLPPDIGERFWLACKKHLRGEVGARLWRIVGVQDVWPLKMQ